MSKEGESLFYSLDSQQKIPLALVEGIFLATDEASDTSIGEVLLSLGVVENDLDSIAIAVTEWFNQNTDKDKRKPAKSGISIGSQFSDTFSKAGFTDVCLILCDFDVKKAEHLYHNEDFRLVLTSFKLKTSLKMAEAFSTYEAMAAVFGGGSDSGDKGEVTTIDVTQGFTGTING